MARDKLEIHVGTPMRETRLVLNGTDISNQVQAFRIEAYCRDDVAEVWLLLTPHLAVIGELPVTVTREDSTPPKAADE